MKNPTYHVAIWIAITIQKSKIKNYTCSSGQKWSTARTAIYNLNRNCTSYCIFNLNCNRNSKINKNLSKSQESQKIRHEEPVNCNYKLNRNYNLNYHHNSNEHNYFNKSDMKNPANCKYYMKYDLNSKFNQQIEHHEFHQPRNEESHELQTQLENAKMSSSAVALWQHVICWFENLWRPLRQIWFFKNL